MIRATVTISHKGPSLLKRIEEIERGLKTKGPKAVKVGLPAGKADAGVIEYAIYNHFGTAGSGKGFVKRGKGGEMIGGFGGPIPARPFITITFFRHRAELRALLRKAAIALIEKGTPLQNSLGLIGTHAAGLIQAQISAGMPPPNAPLTIRIKGSSKPLIDTGRLRQSITWALDDK